MGFPDTDTLVMTAVVIDIAMPSGSSIRKKEHKKQEEREGERERLFHMYLVYTTRRWCHCINDVLGYASIVKFNLKLNIHAL